MRTPRPLPPKILTKVRSICLRLPEVREEQAWVGTRWVIRKKNFAHVLTIEGGWPPAYARAAGSDGPLTVLTFRTSDALYGAFGDTDSRFFQAEWGTRWGTHVVGMALGKRVNWDEVKLLLIESYRLLAPKRLASADFENHRGAPSASGRSSHGRSPVGRR